MLCCSAATLWNIAARPLSRGGSDPFSFSAAFSFAFSSFSARPRAPPTPPLLVVGDKTSSGRSFAAGARSKTSLAAGGSNPATTHATPSELTIHTLAGLPPLPVFSHTSFGGAAGFTHHDSGTHRIASSGGGSGDAVRTIPSALNPGGGTAAHAYAPACFQSWPHCCRNRTGRGNSASVTAGRLALPVIAHAFWSAISSALLGWPLARLGLSYPGATYEPSGTRSRLRAMTLGSMRADQNEAARRLPVPSEVQIFVKLECCLSARRKPESASRLRGTPAVAPALESTAAGPGAPPTPGSPLEEAEAEDAGRALCCPASERASMRTRPAPEAASI